MRFLSSKLWFKFTLNGGTCSCWITPAAVLLALLIIYIFSRVA